jgi:hypothetical protein
MHALPHDALALSGNSFHLVTLGDQTFAIEHIVVTR